MMFTTLTAKGLALVKGWIFGNSTGNSKFGMYLAIILGVMIFYIVVMNTGNITEWLGFSTKASLQADVAVQKTTIASMTEANKQLAKDIAILKRDASETSASLVKLQKAQELLASTYQQRLSSLSQQLVAIDNRKDLTPEQKNKSKATLQIEALHEAYRAYQERSAK